MTKYLCRIISRFTLIINDKVLMFLWLAVIDKKVSHPNEIQNTFEGTKDYESITEVYESKNLYVRILNFIRV